MKLTLMIAALVFTGAAYAQRVTQPADEAQPATPVVATTGTAAPKPDNDEIVEMSVFNVTGSTDDGYAAVNSTSGSRVNTPLRDLAASIDPFTAEFLNDIGATSIEEMLAYAGNVETEFEDATNGFNNNETRFAGTGNNRFRIRGIAATTLVDGVETSVPIDMYNMDRVEIASGANSILYGIGAQGGVVMFSTQRASAQRNKFTIKNILGTWFDAGKAWGFERLLADYNIVLIPKKMAFRINALYLNNNDWQYRRFNDTKRISPAFMVKPFKNTVININYEKGQVKNATSRTTNAIDGYSAWDEAGRPVADHFVLGAIASISNPPAGTSRINGPGGNPYYVLVNNNNTVYDMRATYQSNQVGIRDENGNGTGSGQVLLPPSISPYNYNTVGPGGMRTQKFQDWSVVVEQAIGKLNLELKYSRNQNDIVAISPGAAVAGVNAIRAVLNGDPNGWISPVTWSGAGGVIENPYAGRLYMESTWFKSIKWEKNDALMLTGEYSLDLKKFGRHRIIGLLARTQNEMYTNHLDEILVDDNQVAINVPNNPIETNNALMRRNYLTEGDFTTYYDGAYDGPVTGVVIGDKTYHSAWVSENSIEAHVKRSIDSYMLALQSYWFRGRLATTFGARIDDVSFKKENPGQITDPNDPRILDKSRVFNDMCLDGTWTKPRHFQPFTFSAGAVYHFTKRFSTAANFSTNRGLPYLDGRTVMPTGDLPDMPEGRTFDYGVRFDVFGNSKLVVKLTRFDTRQIGDATIKPAGLSNASNNALGSTNLYRIYDAMYFLYPTSNNGSQAAWGRAPSTGWPSATAPDGGTITTGPGAGPMSESMYAVIPPNQRYPYGTPPQYNASMVDVYSRGFEFSIIGKPAKNIDVRFHFTYSDRNREKIFQEIFDYYNANIPVWMEMADPAKNGGHEYYVVTSADGTQTQKLTDYIWDQLYGSGGVRAGIAGNLISQTGNQGARPWKTNLSVRYTFPNRSYFKGFAVRGAVRYQSPVYIPDPNRITPDISVIPPQSDTTFAFDPNKYYDAGTMIKGDDFTYFDATLTYKRKIFGGRTTMSIQLNVNNIFNENRAGAGRRNTDGTNSRIYPPNPRVIRLDTTFTF